MVKCNYCGKEIDEPNTCDECGNYFCDDCGDPESSRCVDCGVDDEETMEDQAEEEQIEFGSDEE